MKTGLVLEGGAMRGMYTAGVLDTFLEAGISVDGVVGVSAGALFGVNYLSGQKGRVIRYNKRFNGDKNYMGLRPLLREGNLFSTHYAYERVPRELDPKVKELKAALARAAAEHDPKWLCVITAEHGYTGAADVDCEAKG